MWKRVCFLRKERWWQHRFWLAGAVIVALFYGVALFADFLAPYDYRTQVRLDPFSPPATIRWRDAAGNWHWRPFIYPERLLDSLGRQYTTDTQRAYPLMLFPRGYSYRLFGLFSTNRHLFGLQSTEADAPRLYLLGSDELGRDRFSRLLLAARFSLWVGPLGTLVASVLGIVVGCLAGYAGRWLDNLVMRAADAMLALPALVLILAARAAFPPELPPVRAAALMIGIFAALGWAEMARLTRGLVWELRQRDFVLAAVSLGASPVRILWRHILPNAAAPLLTQMLVILPTFLLTETSLSFLGVGLQEPEPSWGNMLTAISDLTLLQRNDLLALLTPAFAIVLFVLGVRLLAEGIEQEQKKWARRFAATRPG
ncbi:MAG: ABC transporter permease [Acidobacteriota bacterium]